MKKYYSCKDITFIQRLLPHRSKNAIIIQAQKLGITSFYSINNNYSEEELKFIINNWKDMSDYQLSQHLNRTQRSIKAKRNELGLHRQNNCLAGYTYNDLNKYLRGNIWQWKKESKTKCNNQCVLTHSKEYDIHHLYSFNLILQEYLELYHISIKDNINDYSSEELEYINKTFNKYHNKYPLGVCINKNLHKLFHKLYGKNTSVEDWQNFCLQYENGGLSEYLS